MNFNYYTKSVYGQDMIYLANASQARAWRNLTGKKTITTEDFTQLQVFLKDVEVTFTRVFEAEA